MQGHHILVQKGSLVGLTLPSGRKIYVRVDSEGEETVAFYRDRAASLEGNDDLRVAWGRDGEMTLITDELIGNVRPAR